MAEAAGVAEANEQLEAIRQQMLEMQKKLDSVEQVKKAQEELKLNARKAAIKAECDKYANKATKRNVKVLMVGMNFVKDIEEVWSALAKEDEGQGIAREDNIVEVNKAIDAMTTLLTKLKSHLQWEFDMNVSAAESKAGWGVVSQAEITKEKEDWEHKCSIKPEQIRKWEIEKMTYDRQVRLAAANYGGGSSSGGSVAAWDNVWLDGFAPRGRGRGRGKRSRGGRGGVQEAARGRAKPGLRCYRCLGVGHSICFFSGATDPITREIARSSPTAPRSSAV